MIENKQSATHKALNNKNGIPFVHLPAKPPNERSSLDSITDRVTVPLPKLQASRPEEHSAFESIFDRLTVHIRKIQVTTSPVERPGLAPNVQLVGQLQASGYKDRQWLVQRDGQFIQLSELLYRIAEHANGEHTLEEIARWVSEVTEWIVSPDQVRHLVHTKLIPMRLISPLDGSVVPSTGGAAQYRGRSVLAVNMRLKLMNPGLIDPITRVLQVLYAPPVLIPLLILIVVARGWLYFVHGLNNSLEAAFNTPGLLLFVIALLFVSDMFHELGHASALRYGGGKVRGIGMGFYLMYPALYTDVTDSYRLGRWARVRTDVGGMYFHLIFGLGIMAFALISRQEFLLLLVSLIDLDVLSENMPFVRFDGYWALADLTGLPDFFSLVGPFVRSVLRLPAGKGSKLPDLKPWVKAVFAVYIIITVCVLTDMFSLLIIYEPSILESSWSALLAQRMAFAAARTQTDVLGMLAPAAQVIALALPLVANFYLLSRLGRMVISVVWRWGKRLPRWSRVALLAAMVTTVLVAFLWAPQLPLLIASGDSLKSVDGITCDHGEQSTEHIHTHLTIYVQGREVAVPQGIGIPPGGNCFFWLHTHLVDGVIHVEAPAKAPYTLGQFTDIWAQSTQSTVLTNTNFLGYPLMGHHLVIWTSDNGQPAQRYTGNPRDVVLRNHELITITYDSPRVQPVTSFDWQHSSAGQRLMP